MYYFLCHTVLFIYKPSLCNVLSVIVHHYMYISLVVNKLHFYSPVYSTSIPTHSPARILLEYSSTEYFKVEYRVLETRFFSKSIFSIKISKEYKFNGKNKSLMIG